MTAPDAVPGVFSQPYDARPWIERYPDDVPRSIEVPGQTVWQILTEVATRHAKREAYFFQGEAMTFAQVLHESDRFSRSLRRLGVARGDRVLALLPNVPHFPVAYYGTLRLGAALAGISPRSVTREIENYLLDARPKVVLTLDILYENLADVWQRAGVEHVVVGTVIDFMPAWKRLAARLTHKVPAPKSPIPYGPRVLPMRDFLGAGRGESLGDEARPDDVALLQYTGGTTGMPKAAMLTHQNLVANALQSVSFFPIMKDGRETIMGVLPFFHIYGITLVLNCGLLLGARTVLLPRGLDLGDIFNAIQRYRPTVFPGVPTIYVSLINDRRSREVDMSSIELCVSGGAPLPVEVKHVFDSMTGGHLLEGYGLSEASPVTHAQTYDERSPAGSIGLPLPGTDARIVNPDTGECVPIGDRGELWIRGPQVMTGYWERPVDTEETLTDGWLHTGDIARMDENGFFYIVDRKKDLIITAGENIYPREIEEVIYEHPKVQTAAVVGVPHAAGGEVAKAFIVLRPGEQASKQEMNEFLSTRLARHKIPRLYEFRDELPTSAAGKVLRRLLAEEERDRAAERVQRRRSTGKAEPDD